MHASRLVAGTTIVHSVTVNAPAADKVIVNASGCFEFNDVNFNDQAHCEITTTTTITVANTMRAQLAFGGSQALHRPAQICRQPIHTVARCNTAVTHGGSFWARPA